MPLIPSLSSQLQAASNGDLMEKTVASQQVFAGRFLQLFRDEVLLPSGQRAGREYLTHPGAVVVVPVLDDGRYLVEIQYRYPLQRFMIEFPAGKIDANEPGAVCGARELEEETGFIATQWAYAGVTHNAIAYSTEHIDIWFARGLQYRGQKLEEGELLTLAGATLPELLQCVYDGTLTDAKTITCLLWLQQTASGHWALDWRDSPAASGGVL